MEASEQLVLARRRAGLSQSRVAELTGISQPNISAYESGRRVPRQETLARLLKVTRRRPSIVLFENRESVLELAAKRHLANVRVFGSSIRGTDTPDSDVDLLVTPESGASLFDLAGLAQDLKELLGSEVDVISDTVKNSVMERIKAEAVPL